MTYKTLNIVLDDLHLWYQMTYIYGTSRTGHQQRQYTLQYIESHTEVLHYGCGQLERLRQDKICKKS